MIDATDITILLDRSGSMASIASDIIGGFNRFLDEQKKLDSPARISLIQFDSQEPHQVVYEGLNIKEAPHLTALTFQPRGSTPLLRSMSEALDCIGTRLAAIPEELRPDKVVFVVITDGEENSSGPEYPKARIAERISHQQSKYNWQILFLGTDFDAFSEAGGLNIVRSQTAKFRKGAAGTAMMYAAVNSSLSGYRSGLRSAVGFTVEEQEAMERAE